MMFYLHTKFHENPFCSFRGVAMTRFWDGQTDGRTDRVTALLDLLSPLATQVKIIPLINPIYLWIDVRYNSKKQDVFVKHK